MLRALALALAACSGRTPHQEGDAGLGAQPDAGRPATDLAAAADDLAATTTDVAGPTADLAGPTADLANATACRADGDGKTTLVFSNACASAVTFAGSDITGGTLGPGETRCVDIGSDVEALNGKRYWGWIGQDPGPERHTLAEFTFNTTFNDFDWYDISMVDAFNLPMQIEPLDRSGCRTLTCAMDLLAGCPTVGQVRDSAGKVVACYSPNRDDGSSTVARYFESCDDAYAWSGDDAQGSDPSPMRACAGEDWRIVFCPGSPP